MDALCLSLSHTGASLQVDLLSTPSSHSLSGPESSKKEDWRRRGREWRDKEERKFGVVLPGGHEGMRDGRRR